MFSGLPPKSRHKPVLDQVVRATVGSVGEALGIGTRTVQRVLMEQPRPFDVDVAEAAFASECWCRRGYAGLPVWQKSQYQLGAADPVSPRLEYVCTAQR
jgi:hypothetical protein